MEESTVAIIISVLALVVSFFTFFNNYVKPFKLLVFPSPRIGYPHMDWSEPGILLHLFFKNNGALPGIVTGLKVVFTSGEKSTEFFFLTLIVIILIHIL
ncbi:MAG: hypothetical protein U9R53_11545 [Chloroflexota bacterium]|nr:hypothetical protein [Chloroflexota bacterium]